MATKDPGQKVAPGIWQLKKNQFSVRVRVQNPRTNQWVGRWRTIDGTKADALRLREQWRAELEAEVAGHATAQMTVKTFAHSWLATKLERADLEPSTAARYAYALDLHVIPALGDAHLDSLEVRDVERWLASQTSKYAARTANSWLRVLRSVLADAERQGLVTRNVARNVRALRERTPEEENSLTAEELRKVLKECRAHYPQHYTLVLTLAFTGCRWGEATALRWDDLEVAEKTGALRIVRSQWRGHVKETKTGKARVVPFPPEFVAAFREHRALLASAKNPGLAAGWCFPSANGELLDNGRLAEPWKRMLRAAGIRRRVTVHGLRRTMTDLLRLASVDWVTAAAVIGHDADRMRQHYSTVRTEEARAAGERVLRLVHSSPTVVGVSPAPMVDGRNDGRSIPECETAG